MNLSSVSMKQSWCFQIPPLINIPIAVINLSKLPLTNRIRNVNYNRWKFLISLTKTTQKENFPQNRNELLIFTLHFQVKPTLPNDSWKLSWIDCFIWSAFDNEWWFNWLVMEVPNIKAAYGDGLHQLCSGIIFLSSFMAHQKQTGYVHMGDLCKGRDDRHPKNGWKTQWFLF